MLNYQDEGWLAPSPNHWFGTLGAVLCPTSPSRPIQQGWTHQGTNPNRPSSWIQRGAQATPPQQGDSPRRCKEKKVPNKVNVLITEPGVTARLPSDATLLIQTNPRLVPKFDDQTPVWFTNTNTTLRYWGSWYLTSKQQKRNLFATDLSTQAIGERSNFPFYERVSRRWTTKHFLTGFCPVHGNFPALGSARLGLHKNSVWAWHPNVTHLMWFLNCEEIYLGHQRIKLQTSKTNFWLDLRWFQFTVSLISAPVLE